MQGNVPDNEIEDEQESSVNLQKLAGTLRSNWYWFGISVVLFFLVAEAYLRYATPVYKVDAKILIKEEESGSNGAIDQTVLEGLGLINGKTNLNNEITILNSVVLMDEVIKKTQANIHYYTEGKFMLFEQYSQLPFRLKFIPGIIDSLQRNSYSFKIQIADKNSYILKNEKTTWRGRWNDTLILPMGKAVVTLTGGLVDDNRQVYLIKIAPYISTSNHYYKSLTTAIPDKQATYITLSLKETLPERGVLILNKLIDVYIQDNINDKNRIADSTIAFINDRLGIVTEDLNNLEKDIAKFKKTNSIVDVNQQGSLLVANTDNTFKQLNDQEVKLSIVESVENYILAHSHSPVPTALTGMEPVFSEMVNQYNELQLSRERLLMNAKETNPLVQTANEQLESMRKNIISSIAAIKSAITLNINSIKNEKGLLSGEVQKVPEIQKTFLEYSRQQAIKQDLYLFLLKTREQTAITKSSSIGNARVLEPPACRSGPFSPNRIFTLYAAIFLGLIIPGIIIYIRILFNDKILNKGDIADLSKITVVGEIGHNSSKENTAIVPGSKTVIAEQFRFLCTNLQFYLANKESKVVLITSSMVNEGKSFISLNLAGSFAFIGKKVVVMELDLHRPKISFNLGMDNDIGFTNYAIGKASIDDIIYSTDKGFDIISSGPIPPNPTELILLPIIKELFTELRKRYDYIVIDTPPIGLVADAQAISDYADATLYIVRQRFTYKSQLKIANELFRNKKMPKISLVINDNLMGKGSYGYGYGYAYGYTYGYSEEVKKESIIKRIFNKNKKA